MTDRLDWTGVRALSFDCYGTLIDWERGILEALAPWVARHGREVVLGGFAAIEPDIEHMHPQWPYRQIITEVYRAMAETLGEPVDADAAFGFAVSIGAWPPFADTVGALRRLAGRFRLFILSNVDEVSISGSLAQLEVDFAGVFTAEAIGSYKPNSANFQYLLDQLARRGIAAHELVHVAQSLFHDHVPAQALGIRSIWIDRNNGQGGATRLPAFMPQLDARFPTLAALADAVEQNS